VLMQQVKRPAVLYRGIRSRVGRYFAKSSPSCSVIPQFGVTIGCAFT
jgi:hypothetical protein